MTFMQKDKQQKKNAIQKNAQQTKIGPLEHSMTWFFVSPHRHRPALGECLSSFACCFPVAFLEPERNKFNRNSLMFGIEEEKLAEHSLEAQGTCFTGMNDAVLCSQFESNYLIASTEANLF